MIAVLHAGCIIPYAPAISDDCDEMCAYEMEAGSAHVVA